jgi:hypothetical protein
LTIANEVSEGVLQRHPITVCAAPEQIEADGRTIDLLPEVIETHEQSRGKPIRLGIDIATPTLPRLDVRAATS